ncbi:MAG: hypothetical protein WBW99_08630, partial [Pseudolabrys sp.]
FGEAKFAKRYGIGTGPIFAAVAAGALVALSDVGPPQPLGLYSHGEYRHCDPDPSVVDTGRREDMGTAACAGREEDMGTAACAGREEGAGTTACAGSPSNARRIVSSGAPNSSAGAGTAACAGREEGGGTAASARELNAALSYQQRSLPCQ